MLEYLGTHHPEHGLPMVPIPHHHHLSANLPMLTTNKLLLADNYEMVASHTYP
jgi:hypothetical protein